MDWLLTLILWFILLDRPSLASFPRRCGNQPVISATPGGWLTSPNFPYRYHTGLDCRWNIRAKLHEKIELYIEVFLLDGRRDYKCFDYLGITDSSLSPADPVLFSGCGQELRSRTLLLSGTNEVFVTFHSHEYSAAPSGARFALHYQAVGCPLFRGHTGPIEVSLHTNNKTGLAETAIVRCSVDFAFKSAALRKQGFQLLRCDKKSNWNWSEEPGECIAMTSPAASIEVTVATVKMTSQSKTSETTIKPQQGNDGPNGGVVAGVILGLLVAILLVVLAIFFWRRHKRGKGTPRRPPAVHNDQVYGPTTQPIETVSGKSRFGLFQKSKDKYNKNDHHGDVHQAKNLLTNGRPSKNTDVPGLYEEVDDNSRTQLTVNMHDHSDTEDHAYYETDKPDVVHIEHGATAGHLDGLTTIENQNYGGP